MSPVCLLKQAFWENDLAQLLQVYGYSFVCVLICTVNCVLREKLFKHWLQGNGLSASLPCMYFIDNKGMVSHQCAISYGPLNQLFVEKSYDIFDNNEASHLYVFNVNIQVSLLRERQRALITKVRFLICMHFYVAL